MIYLSNLYVSYMRDFELLAIYKKTVEREEKTCGKNNVCENAKEERKIMYVSGEGDRWEREREREISDGKEMGQLKNERESERYGERKKDENIGNERLTQREETGEGWERENKHVHAW